MDGHISTVDIINEVLGRCRAGVLVFEDEGGGVTASWSINSPAAVLLGLCYFSQAQVVHIKSEVSGVPQGKPHSIQPLDPTIELEFITTDNLLNELKRRFWPTAFALLRPTKTVENHTIHITGSGSKIQTIGLMAYAALQIQSHMWQLDEIPLENLKQGIKFDNILDLDDKELKVAAYLEEIPRIMIEGPNLGCIGLGDMIRHIAFVEMGADMKPLGGSESAGDTL